MFYLHKTPLPAKQNAYQNSVNQITHSSSNSTVSLPQTVDLSYINNDCEDEAEYLFTVYNMSNSQKEYVVENKEKESFVYNSLNRKSDSSSFRRHSYVNKYYEHKNF